MSYLEKAIQVAFTKLEGKTDKAGRPLILHALRTMLRMDTEEEMAAAVLHDVPEESGYLVGTILSWVFGNEWRNIPSAKHVEDSLMRLTHHKGTTYVDYINIISANPLATKIKIADLLDNLDPKRLALLEEDVQAFLGKRYGKALNKLGYHLL